MWNLFFNASSSLRHAPSGSALNDVPAASQNIVLAKTPEKLLDWFKERTFPIYKQESPSNGNRLWALLIWLKNIFMDENGFDDLRFYEKFARAVKDLPGKDTYLVAGKMMKLGQTEYKTEAHKQYSNAFLLLVGKLSPLEQIELILTKEAREGRSENLQADFENYLWFWLSAEDLRMLAEFVKDMQQDMQQVYLALSPVSRTAFVDYTIRTAVVDYIKRIEEICENLKGMDAPPGLEAEYEKYRESALRIMEQALRLSRGKLEQLNQKIEEALSLLIAGEYRKTWKLLQEKINAAGGGTVRVNQETAKLFYDLQRAAEACVSLSKIITQPRPDIPFKVGLELMRLLEQKLQKCLCLAEQIKLPEKTDPEASHLQASPSQP